VPDLKRRIEKFGHSLVELVESEVLINLSISEVFQSEVIDSALGNNKLHLILCYNGSINQLRGLRVRGYRQRDSIGFSVIPPITDSSILEIARPLQTPIAELEKARSFFESLGFKVVEVPDGPGLIQARIVACLANEAFSALSEGVADAKTIDTAMKLGTNYPLGPLEWAEFLGLESILAIMEGLQSEYGEDRYRPHPLLKRLVAANMSIAQFEAWKREK
jgi:3-hydroxyacyl-CoA dehydrogenase